MEAMKAVVRQTKMPQNVGLKTRAGLSSPRIVFRRSLHEAPKTQR